MSSKFAVRGLVMALANELAPRIRVNGVAPGGTVGTDLRGLDAASASRSDASTTAPDAGGADQPHAAGRRAQPADHAGSYVFLASDRARGITGTFVHPDGGIGVKS